ncbi:MAG TPA: peptidase S1, partial [Variovorax sp.]
MEPDLASQALQTPDAAVARRRRWQPFRWSFALLLAMAVGLGAAGALMWPRGGHQLTQKDIDAAVLHTLQTTTLPSPAARAAEIIRPSVVRVVAYG